MLLDATTRKLQLVLTAAMTTANMPVSVYYVDTTATALPVSGITPTNSNGTTPVDILAAPAASTQRKVNALTVNNADTAAKTVQIYLDDNGTDYLLCAATLQVGDVLGYTDTTGWYVQDSAGSRKTTVGLTSSAVTTALGFTPENVANKSIDGTFAANSDTLYPSQKATKTYVDNKTVTAANVAVTQRTIGNSTNLDTALGNLDDSQVAQADTGFFSWSGAGDYYDAAFLITDNKIKILRAGTGYILGKKIEWAAPQTTVALTLHAAHWVYINSSGLIGITTSRTHALYHDNILLFEVHYTTGTDYEVVWENHSCSMDADVQEFIHESVGTIFTPVEGTNTVGADMTRVATGTGAAAGDRQIKIVGAADINDAGVVTNVPDSAGAAITWRVYYTDASGYWAEYATTNQLPMFYNNAGTPTALATSGGSDVGIYTCYAVKGEPNSGLPIYIAVMHTAAYGTDALALAVVGSGANAIATGTLFQALEPAQLGHLIVTNNGTSGYISTVSIAKDVLRAAISGGGATSASAITTNTINFLGTLTAAESNVQLALEAIDKIERLSTDIASATTTDLFTGTGNAITVTGSVTIVSFGNYPAGHLLHLTFSGAPLITYNATTMILPGGANIQTAAGDTMILRSLGNGTGAGSVGNYWKCVAYNAFNVTGTGATARATSPSFVTPLLGTPTSGDLRNCSLAVAPAIGGTTPNSGAFTTLSATQSISITKPTGGEIVILAADTSTAVYLQASNGSGCTVKIGVAGDNGSFIGTTSAHDTRIAVNGAVAGTFSATGLAVTGTISGTTITGTANPSILTESVALLAKSVNPIIRLQVESGSVADANKYEIRAYNVAGAGNQKLQFRSVNDAESSASTLATLDSTGLAVTGAISGTSLNLDKTITAAGTTGAQTINKATGTVNFAAAAASLVVTNSLVTANSVINCTIGTNDSTMKSVQAIAAAGSFTIYPNAVPTAETRVNFRITN